MSKRVLLAVVGAPQGLSGEMRLRVYTEDPLGVAGYGALQSADGRRFEIIRLRPAKDGMVVAQIAGITTREAAEALSGLELFVDRDQLPGTEDAETFYLADLIGLDVVTTAGASLGRVLAVENFGAGDLLEIAPHGRRTGEFLPFTREFVPEIDLERGRIVVCPPDGLFAAESEGP
jgi:16S rRNA processing protein RimM